MLKVKLIVFLIKSVNCIEFFDGKTDLKFESVEYFINYLIQILKIDKKVKYILYTIDFRSNEKLQILLSYLINFKEKLNLQMEARNNTYYEIRIKKKIIFRNIFHILNSNFENLLLLFNISKLQSDMWLEGHMSRGEEILKNYILF